MLSDDEITNLKKFLISPGSKVNLKDFATKYTGSELNKGEAERLLENGRNTFENIGKMIVRLEEIVKKLSEKEDNSGDEFEEIWKELNHLKSDFHEFEVGCAKQHGGKSTPT